MAVVTLDQVCKQFKNTADLAVDHVDLKVADGEFMVLLGPSGCGKSTTLRMIAGLETISSGTLSIDGRVVNDEPAKDRDIAMVFQSYALYPHMTVEDNLAFGLRRRKIDKAEISRRVSEVAQTLGLSELLARKPFALSGGQRQRVALGRAIVREPKVFLFDEPLSNLDAALRVSTRLELAKLHRRLDATMIYVTHDQVEAMTLGDRICVMQEGRVAQIGAPLDVYRHPASVFVARFLGSPPMNILPAKLESTDGGPVAVTEAGRLALTGFSADALGPYISGARSALLGLRPEDVTLEDAAGAPLSANVQGLELLGAETIAALDLKTAGGELLIRAPRDTMVRVGDQVGLRPDLAELHIFDAETGAALPRAGQKTGNIHG